MIKHIQKWNEWRKNNLNSPFHKILVLLKLHNSPTFEAFLTQKQMSKIIEAFEKGLKDGESNV